MAQVAMQQTMDEIIDYLAAIDEKLDDVLRAQEDAVWADMIGVSLDIDEAMVIREHAGRASEVTWSKVQATSATIARTQAYALRQLDVLAEKMERKAKTAAGRFLLVTQCISACHRGSMSGSCYRHQRDSLAADGTVRITVSGAGHAGQATSAGRGPSAARARRR
jgi:hypothetical protein